MKLALNIAIAIALYSAFISLAWIGFIIPLRPPDETRSLGDKPFWKRATNPERFEPGYPGASTNYGLPHEIAIIVSDNELYTWKDLTTGNIPWEWAYRKTPEEAAQTWKDLNRKQVESEKKRQRTWKQVSP